MREFKVFTDGSAVVRGANKGRGGYGVYFPDFYGDPLGIHEGFENTKTGRMEIMALLTAIEAFHIDRKEGVLLKVYSDSQYVVKSFTEERLEKWICNNWYSYGEKIKNDDLWKRVLDALADRLFISLEMHWVKGHQLDKEKDPTKKEKLKKDPIIIGNAMADKLADKWRTNKQLKEDL